MLLLLYSSRKMLIIHNSSNGKFVGMRVVVPDATILSNNQLMAYTKLPINLSAVIARSNFGVYCHLVLK